MKKYKRFEPIEFKASTWFHYFSREDKDGEWYDGFLLRLPSWGFGYDVRRDGSHWGQRVLRWHGKNGFSVGWDFPPIDETSRLTL